MPDSTIHIRVPRETKGRWVRASRAANMRLGDWITQIVEDHMAHIGNQNAAKDEKADTHLHIRCTRADKAAWVKAAAPGKLSAWVVAALNEKAKAK